MVIANAAINLSPGVSFLESDVDEQMETLKVNVRTSHLSVAHLWALVDLDRKKVWGGDLTCDRFEVRYYCSKLLMISLIPRVESTWSSPRERGLSVKHSGVKVTVPTVNLR